MHNAPDPLNRLRLVVLVALLGYFAFLFARPPTAPEPEAKPASSQPGCYGQIEQVLQGSQEVRLRIRGAAERILVYTDQGSLSASTAETGSAGEYRIRTPAPATAVQLDDCPVLNLR